MTSFVPQAMHKASWVPLKGTMSAQKALQGSKSRDEGVAGRNRKDQYFSDKGSLICPPSKSMILHKKGSRKNWVSGQTCLVGSDDHDVDLKATHRLHHLLKKLRQQHFRGRPRKTHFQVRITNPISRQAKGFPGGNAEHFDTPYTGKQAVYS